MGVYKIFWSGWQWHRSMLPSVPLNFRQYFSRLVISGDIPSLFRVKSLTLGYVLTTSADLSSSHVLIPYSSTGRISIRKSCILALMYMLFSFVCTTLARQRLWQTGRSCHKSWVWMLLYFPGPVTPGIWTPWLVEVDTGSRSSTFQDLDFVNSCQFVSTIQHKEKRGFLGIPYISYIM